MEAIGNQLTTIHFDGPCSLVLQSEFLPTSRGSVGGNGSMLFNLENLQQKFQKVIRMTISERTFFEVITNLPVPKCLVV